MRFLNTIISLSILGLLVLPRSAQSHIRRYALTVSVLIFLSSIGVCLNKISIEEMVIERMGVANILEGSLLIDTISTPFVILTTFIIPFCILVSRSIFYQLKNFLLLLLVAELILVNAFTTTNLLVFYICFEAILIPFFLIVGIWGSRHEERVSAAYQLVIFTLIGSFVFLIALTLIYQTVGSFDYFVLKNAKLPTEMESFIFIAFFIALAVKVPMFPFYIWLPKAHVEAPTAGSVLLAGILLKLGSYGMIRFLFLFQDACRYFAPLVITLSLIGVIISLLAALRQTDLKRIIAYSSISHLNYLNLGLFSAQSYIGLAGGFSLMIFHGIVSSALFLSVGILYDRYKTRNIFYFRQLANTMPIFAITFFILTMANIGLPGTSNFVSELMIFTSIFEVNMIAALCAAFSLFISAIAGFWTITRILFGNYQSMMAKLSPRLVHVEDVRPNFAADLNKREIIILLPFLVLVVVFGLKPNILLSLSEFQLGQLIWINWMQFLEPHVNAVGLLDYWWHQDLSKVDYTLQQKAVEFLEIIRAERAERMARFSEYADRIAWDNFVILTSERFDDIVRLLRAAEEFDPVQAYRNQISQYPVNEISNIVTEGISGKDLIPEIKARADDIMLEVYLEACGNKTFETKEKLEECLRDAYADIVISMTSAWDTEAIQLTTEAAKDE